MSDKNLSSRSFVFEDWKALAETNPKDFEHKRRKLISSFISSAPARHRQRLEGLQWQIDLERKRSTNPLSACVRISSMMMKSVYGKSGLADALYGKVEKGEQTPAKVISLAERAKPEK